MTIFTNHKKNFYLNLSLIQGLEIMVPMMSLWVPCFRKSCSTPRSCLLLLVNQSISLFFSLSPPPQTHTHDKRIRAQGHRYIFANVSNVLNCCPLDLNTPEFQSPALSDRMEEKKEFLIIGGTLISSKYAKISHATQNTLFQTQGQKGKREEKRCFPCHTGAPEKIFTWIAPK